MKLPTFTRDELTEFLSNGIPMPKSAIMDENTIDFYFGELEAFINSAENEYWARITSYLEITISVNEDDFLILRFVDNNVCYFLINTRPDMLDTLTTNEAEDVLAMVYGVIVFNDKWIEVNELVEEFTKELANSFEYNATKAKIKMDPHITKKLNKSPIQYPDKTMKMKDYDKYFKKNKDKKYG